MVEMKKRNKGVKNPIIVRDGVSYKKCAGECDLEKELNKDNFQWENSANRWNARCKICINKKRAEYRAENREEIRKTDNQYYQENKDTILKRNKNYYENNKEECIKRVKLYEQNNKEKISLYKSEYAKNNEISLKIYRKEYYQKNKEGISERGKIYRKKNKDKITIRRKISYIKNRDKILYNCKIYYENNKNKIIKRQNAYEKNRRKTDPVFKLMKNISREVNRMLKGKKAGRSTKKHLPFTEEQLEKHMENEFKKPGNEWMNWNNQGSYNKGKCDENDFSTWKWQPDHIKPISDFDIKDLSDEEFMKCWSLDNLRPLSAIKNLMDGVNRVRHKSKQKNKRKESK